MKMLVRGIKVSHPTEKVKGENIYCSVLVDGLDGFYSVLPCTRDVYRAVSSGLECPEFILSYFKGTSQKGVPYTMVSLDLTDKEKEKLNK